MTFAGCGRENVRLKNPAAAVSALLTLLYFFCALLGRRGD
jgi:hypothetical protein